MRGVLRKIRFVFFCIASFGAYGQKVNIGPPPSWLIPEAFDLQGKGVASESTGYYYLLLGEQVNLQQQERYVHRVYKILNTEGLQEMADISIDFDPTYQHLTFHKIAVYRDGKTISHLSPGAFKTIQREQDADRYLYDGNFTSITNLKDIRIGDIIDFSYTRKGFNPIFEGLFATTTYFDYGMPYEKYEYRLIAPADEKIYTQEKNNLSPPSVITKGNTKVYSWVLEKNSSLMTENNTPGWYDPYRNGTLTNIKDWEQVAQWAVRQFAVDPIDLQKIKKQTEEKFSTKDKSIFIRDAIRFVQDEIRYLGFESGLNSHKPHAPLQIMEQRFGDCKDKSLLLSSILQTEGVEAYPMLVNSSWSSRTDGHLASITAFDHCVVQIILEGKTFYIDPTISNQGGAVESIDFPDYGKGLIVKPGIKTLVDLPLPSSGKIIETQYLSVSEISGPATMSVETKYFGSKADAQRSEFNSTSIDDVQKRYLTFYTNLYPSIQKAEKLTVEDDREANIFIVREKYTIKKFWQTSKTVKDQLYCEMYALSLETYFNVSKNTERKSAYALSFPVNYEHHVSLRLPSDWPIIPDAKTIDTRYYHYEYKISSTGPEVYMDTQYKTKDDHIPADSVERFVTDHQVMMGNLGYNILQNKVDETHYGTNWYIVFISMVSTMLAVWLCFYLFNHYNPKTLTNVNDGTPVGGWLILVAIGVTTNPFLLAYNFYSNPNFFQDTVWLANFKLKNWGLLVFVLLELIYNSALVVYTLLLLLLFYQRRSSFPRLMIIFLACAVSVAFLDTIVARAISPSRSNADWKDFIRALAPAAVWIPYLIYSERVKETFVNIIEHPSKESQEENL